MASTTRPQAIDELSLYVIYNEPSDYPGKFVLRRWGTITGPDKEPMVVSDHLNDLYDKMPEARINLGRADNDDPVIYEVWI